MLVLTLFAIVLLDLARRTSLPYPAMLALAGIGAAALPWAPAITIDPHLALALFIAPALLDSAYDLPPRELRRHWVPLLALAAIAVLLTTAAVAWTLTRIVIPPAIQRKTLAVAIGRDSTAATGA